MPIWSIGNIIAWAKDQVGVMLGTKGCSDANLNRILNEAEIQIRRAGGNESDIEQAKGEVIRICEEWHARQTDVPATAQKIEGTLATAGSGIWARITGLLDLFTNPVVLLLILVIALLTMFRRS